MALSYDLISQFAKLTSPEKKQKTETTVFGTIIESETGNKYVKIDGSDLLTPLSDDNRPSTDSSLVAIDVGDRVSILIKDHTATITGNVSSPAAKDSTVSDVASLVQANQATIGSLEADVARIRDLDVDELTAATGKITELEAKYADIEDLTAKNFDATNAEIENLKVEHGEFEDLTAKNFEATNATVKNLDAKYAAIDYATINEATIDSLNTKYLTADYAQVDEANVNKLYAETGLINYVTAEDATVTGHLVGVTITGDLIEGGTVKADKLVILGDDGVYYKLNYEAGVLTGDEVAKTHYYLVTYNAETDEYIASEVELKRPEGDHIRVSLTTDGKQVYETADGVLYCIDEKIEKHYYSVTYNAETDEYTASEDESEPLEGEPVEDALTIDGKQVYETEDGVLYCVDEVAIVNYYLVTYDSETDEYITSEDVFECTESEHVEAALTTDGKQVYETEDGVLYCIDEVLKTIYHPVAYNSKTDEYTAYEDEVEIVEGEPVENVLTTDGRQVYTTAGGVLYCVDEVTETICYLVTYNAETDEYIPSEIKLERPEGEPVEDAFTAYGNQQVYETADGMLYCTEVIYPDWAKDSLHGSIITAKSVTAEKVSVSDLVAFGADIGGFHITDNAIYSGVKASADSTIKGTYMDTDGQFSIGDAVNFLRYYKTVDENGDEVYKLEISAESVLFGVNSRTSAADLKNLADYVKIGSYHDPETDEDNPCVELTEDDTDTKQIMTNAKTMIIDGEEVKTEISSDGVKSENLTVRGEIRHGGYVSILRDNGNYGLIWREDV